MTTASYPSTQRASGSAHRSWVLLAAGLPLCFGILLLCMLASIAFGTADIHPSTVWAAVTAFDPTDTNHLIIQTLRLPRALTAVLVGAALATAGSIMQGLTRNPLADPGLLGIEAGAALAVVAAVMFLHINSMSSYALYAVGGAGVTAVVVYALGSMGRGGPTPFKLTIAGAALTAMLASFTTAILLFNERTLEEVRFWLVGSVAGRDMTLVMQAAPYFLAGLLMSLLLARQITTLALGDDVAASLGQNVALIKGLSTLVTVVLSGVAVALAGPIGFIGLVIPHMVRFFVGVDYRWILPYSMLLRGIFLVACDVIGRVIARPSELAVGVMTALIGGPVFIALVLWKVMR